MITNQILVWSLGILFVAGAILGVVLLFLALLAWGKKKDTFSPITKQDLGKWTVMAILGLAAFSPLLFTEFVFGTNMLLVDGRVIQAFPKHTIMTQWRWNALTKGENIHLVSYEARNAAVGMSVHPITENPKVRSLRLHVVAQTIEDPLEFAKLQKVIGAERMKFGNSKYIAQQNVYINVPLQKHVTSLLYEFNEAHSRDLAVFYNPLDQTQQMKFAALVRSFLDSKLNEVGAFVSSARFDMEN